MTGLERRFAALLRQRPLDLSRRPGLIDGRFLRVAAAAALEQLAQVRTSAAFAARFEAQANHSGLVLDRERRSPIDFVRKCRICNADVRLHDLRCFNCNTSLESRAQRTHDLKIRAERRERLWEAQVRAGTVPEARFARVLEARPVSLRPWTLACTSLSRWKTLA